jgi:hypothetical protein
VCCVLTSADVVIKRTDQVVDAAWLSTGNFPKEHWDVVASEFRLRDPSTSIGLVLLCMLVVCLAMELDSRPVSCRVLFGWFYTFGKPTFWASKVSTMPARCQVEPTRPGPCPQWCPRRGAPAPPSPGPPMSEYHTAPEGLREVVPHPSRCCP